MSESRRVSRATEPPILPVIGKIVSVRFVDEHHVYCVVCQHCQTTTYVRAGERCHNCKRHLAILY